MKIENIREVKAHLSRIVGELPSTGSVVVTKNGRPCAVLMPVTEETDLEVVALSQNRAFWRRFDDAVKEAEDAGWTSLDVATRRSRVRRPRKGSAARR
jgi:prevent-host-death family protein